MTKPPPSPTAELLADYLADLAAAGIDGIYPRADETVTPPETVTAVETAPKIVPETSAPSDGFFPILEPETESPHPMASKIDAILKKMSPHPDVNEKRDVLAQLAKVVAGCRRCPELVANRTKTVFSDGNPDADLVFIGEGPGADEDRQGVPFVGRSGQLLTDIITKGMKLKREDVFICNIVRCRPPGNRNPTPEEAACCRPFLDATLAVVQPKFICCLGAVAATNLLGMTESLGRLRGRIFDHNGAKVVCSYHPAYLLRNPPAKVQTWEDIKLLLKEMRLL